MNKIRTHYKDFLTHTPSLVSCAAAFLFFFVSLIVNFLASQYAYVKKDNAVTDLLLDNLPVIHMDDAFVIGTWLFLILVTAILLARPHRLPFILKSMALFIIIRSIFVTLTHLGPSPLNTLSAPSEIGRAFSSGADLFFSGHTGMPFLFALMYWHNIKMRYLFIAISILAAAGVLLGHIHYSIDVASAYFITHGIFLISQRLFKTDWKRFNNNY